jgi:hypothetical protein
MKAPPTVLFLFDLLGRMKGVFGEESNLLFIMPSYFCLCFTGVPKHCANWSERSFGYPT